MNIHVYIHVCGPGLGIKSCRSWEYGVYLDLQFSFRDTPLSSYIIQCIIFLPAERSALGRCERSKVAASMIDVVDRFIVDQSSKTGPVCAGPSYCFLYVVINLDLDLGVLYTKREKIAETKNIYERALGEDRRIQALAKIDHILKVVNMPLRACLWPTVRGIYCMEQYYARWSVPGSC